MGQEDPEGPSYVLRMGFGDWEGGGGGGCPFLLKYEITNGPLTFSKNYMSFKKNLILEFRLQNL